MTSTTTMMLCDDTLAWCAVGVYVQADIHALSNRPRSCEYLKLIITYVVHTYVCVHWFVHAWTRLNGGGGCVLFYRYDSFIGIIKMCVAYSPYWIFSHVCRYCWRAWGFTYFFPNENHRQWPTEFWTTFVFMLSNGRMTILAVRAHFILHNNLVICSVIGTRLIRNENCMRPCFIHEYAHADCVDRTAHWIRIPPANRNCRNAWNACFVCVNVLGLVGAMFDVCPTIAPVNNSMVRTHPHIRQHVV